MKIPYRFWRSSDKTLYEKETKKEKGFIFWRVLFSILLIWISLTTLAYQWNNPSKTQMQAFRHIPKSFMFDVLEEKR